MYQPKVSIIIPVYNGRDYLTQSIESALKQTYRNFEIIVINDGSTDDGETKKIAEKYKDRIKYFHKENGGVSTALNYGISKMGGEFFSWLSHDDLYHPEKLEEQIKYLNKVILNNAIEVSKAVLYCDTEYINDKSEVILRLKPIAKEFESTRNIIVKNLKNNRLGGCSFLVHKNALLEMKGFNESIKTVSDYDLWYRLLLNNYQFFYVPKTLVQGRMHKNQVTYRMSEIGYREFDEFHIWLLNSLDKKTEFNDYNIYYKIACYARQRGYNKSAKYGFKLMKKRSASLKYYSLKSIGIVYSDFYKIAKNTSKKIYTKIFIK